ncbi:FAD-dependent oxidoreductase, partial [Saccharomonospora iraqiensis]|uniref:FAD-dependent oxidoreductase n=1 Tax=Saccharomonospora iraqiensis TaxID=52698 RepID=UPI00022E20BD
MTGTSAPTGGANPTGCGAPPREVAVVGAGVIGLAVAWRVAEAGHRVTVFDPHPARGASWVAGGMLAPVAEAWPG